MKNLKVLVLISVLAIGLKTFAQNQPKIEGLNKNTKSGERIEMAFHFKVSNKDFDIETPHFMGITMADEVEVSVEVNGMLSNIKGETL